MDNFSVYNLIIVDQSGSMMSIYDMALSSLNETIQTIRNNQKTTPEINQYVSIVTFSGAGLDGVKTVRDRVPVTHVSDLTKEDYRPDGCTPLYDAIGKSVTYLQSCITEKDKVLVTIITDGFENTSCEYTATSVRSIIELLRAKGWTFGFIGANQDAVLTAKELGIKNALNFESTKEGTAIMSKKMAASNVLYWSRVSKSIITGDDSDIRDLDDLYSSPDD